MPRKVIGFFSCLFIPLYGYALIAQLGRLPNWSGTVFWFLAGALLQGMFWLVLSGHPRLLFLRNLHHELNHYVWCVLMGANDVQLTVGSRGGWVRAVFPEDRWGREISDLAPYFFPLFALPLAGIHAMVRPPSNPVLAWAVGWCVSWYYFDLGYILIGHAAGKRSQNELVRHGKLFAFLLITALNLLFTGIVLCAVYDPTSVGGFLFGEPQNFYNLLVEQIR